MVHSSTLPPQMVAAQARLRLTQYWLPSVLSYFASGCFTSLQPTATRLQRAGKLLTILLLLLRGAQISAVDAQPLEMLQLGTITAMLPFAIGLLFMQQQEVLVRMWLEIGFAKREARNTNARVAAERQRALALEMARREMLVARKSTRWKKRRRSTPRATLSSNRSKSNESLPIDDVIKQEEGYQSPVEPAEF